jgi:large subunit ribosomal protein L10
MPKTRQQKKVILDELSQKVKDSKSIIFTKFEKLQVKENEDLRRRLKAEGGEYVVTKKTLLNLTLKDNALDVDLNILDGKVAAVFSYKDEVAPAKVVDNFRKELEEEKIFSWAVFWMENLFRRKWLKIWLNFLLNRKF